MKKLALALSGGGFKGAFQVGALQYLQEHWQELHPHSTPLKFDVVTGVSVGSLNGLLVASNKFPQLVNLWDDVAQNGVEEIYISDFIDTKAGGDTIKLKFDFAKLTQRFIPSVNINNVSIFQAIGLLVSKKKREEFLQNLLKIAGNDLQQNLKHFKSLADNAPLKKKLDALAKISDIKDCIFRCGYVSLNDGEYYSFRHSEFNTDSDFAAAILASTAQPVVWPPVETIRTAPTNRKSPQKFSVDGGIRNVSPLYDVISEINNDPSASEYLIIIINCSNGKIEPEDYTDKNIAQIAVRSLADIAITEIFNHDIKEFVDKNFILQQVLQKHPGEELLDYDYENKRPGRPLRHFETIIIQPDDSLGDGLVANEALIAHRLQQGRQKAAQGLADYLNRKGGFRTAIT
jgi:NTE family protein